MSSILIPKTIKSSIRKILTKPIDAYHISRYKLQVLFYKNKSMQDVFSDIYTNSRWGNVESISGGGSDLQQTSAIIRKLPSLIEKLEIKSILDAPCGDFHWMKEIDLNLEQYIGCDIVSDLIEKNKIKYGNEKIDFFTLNLAKDDLPKTDLIFCRDCLVHLSYEDTIAVLKNFKKSGATYLLTTTYPQLLTRNKDITTGDWRAIDLQLSPYNFPQSIEILNEETTEPKDYSQKSLGLWKLADIDL
jgi:SAM-dependent methyltransferase